MRVKISFLRDQKSSNSIPLHHQKLVYDAFHQLAGDLLKDDKEIISFSSLKGTTRIQNGIMRFLSTKVTMVISSHKDELVRTIVDRMLSGQKFSVGRMDLIAKKEELIDNPDFDTKMRYLFISPLVLGDPRINPDLSKEHIDPLSPQFSDILYNRVLDQMEKAGYTEKQINQFAEFEASADEDYVQRMSENGKKFARWYKCKEGHTMVGYLIPFTLHAHKDVHKFVWEVGLGALLEQGYGMIDTVKST
ncbi:MAG TPA: CRISPR-associated endoribonuclease Cas6 [Bacteroidia bacterium]|nr:CRISPR-associated endoribonuclease Cas6 [Bacteroidia bacterium]HNT80149.1 CRISPR-associated endoribonuclease Cas6 [Bacteroidia bacterium]